jgi:hypothetical protein
MIEPFAVIVDDVSQDHPLYGSDIRRLPESVLAQAAAMAILPALDRYLAYMDVSNLRGGQLFNLAASARHRIERLLMLRNRLKRLTSHVPTIDDMDELSEIITLGFVHLMGVFDVLAIIASDVAGLNLKPSNIGWQKKDFRQALRNSIGNELVNLIEPETEGGMVFAVVKEIRNTIHRLTPRIASSHKEGSDSSMVRAILLFERDSHEEIINALNATDWFQYVGIDRVGEGMIFARPGTLLDLSLDYSICLFNDLMETTPVERLGCARKQMSPEQTLFPISVRRYALDFYSVKHLAKHFPSTAIV